MAEPDSEMIFTTRAHAPGPRRLLWLFVQSLAASALVAAALYAALYVAQDIRARGGAVAPPPAGGASAGPGLEVLTPFDDAESLAAAVGFTPVLPDDLPAGAAAPKFDATQPGEDGARRAEIRYAAPRDAAGRAIGPSLLLAESRTSAAGGTGAVAHAAGSGRYAAVISCGGVTIAATLFFPASVVDTDAAAQAARFFDALSRQCAR